MSPTIRLAAAACCLVAPLTAQRALLDRLPPDADVGGHSYVGFGSELEPWGLPGEGLVTGFAKVGDRCWIARGTQLHCVDWSTRRTLRTTEAPAELFGLCADQRFLYGVAGRNLHMLDPVAGTSMRTVAIAAAWPPSSITMHRGVLHISVDQTVMTLDAKTGAVKDVTQLGTRVLWIASDGANLWYGSAGDCRPFACDGAAAAWQGRLWPWTIQESAASWTDGRLLVAIERRDERDRCEQVAGLLAPVTDVPSRGLLVSIRVDGAKVGYEVDWTPVADEKELVAELRRLARERAAFLVGPEGKEMRIPVVLEARFDVKVRDVARAWDAVSAAGFESVHCPPLEGWVRRQQAEEARAPAKK